MLSPPQNCHTACAIACHAPLNSITVPKASKQSQSIHNSRGQGTHLQREHTSDVQCALYTFNPANLRATSATLSLSLSQAKGLSCAQPYKTSSPVPPISVVDSFRVIAAVPLESFFSSLSLCGHLLSPWVFDLRPKSACPSGRNSVEQDFFSSAANQ